MKLAARLRHEAKYVASLSLYADLMQMADQADRDAAKLADAEAKLEEALEWAGRSTCEECGLPIPVCNEIAPYRKEIKVLKQKLAAAEARIKELETQVADLQSSIDYLDGIDLDRGLKE